MAAAPSAATSACSSTAQLASSSGVSAQESSSDRRFARALRSSDALVVVQALAMASLALAMTAAILPFGAADAQLKPSAPAALSAAFWQAARSFIVVSMTFVY